MDFKLGHYRSEKPSFDDIIMTRCDFSDTIKDSTKNRRSTTTLELARREDGSFDLFLNAELSLSIQEKWLAEEICVRYGFCGHEYDEFLREVKQLGRAKVTF
jgi:hypothetical protein